MFDPDKKKFDWLQFRSLARLERKTDESLERYFYSFVSMCRTACRLPPRKDEGIKESYFIRNKMQCAENVSSLKTFSFFISLFLTVQLCLSGPIDHALLVEPITEERAARTLYRIELLRKIREQVLRHPLLGQRLQLCQPSLYLPVWWECGKHDRDLLIGAAKHGLSRTDYYILNDPQLSFLEAHRNYVRKENHGYPVPASMPGMPHRHCCLYDAGLSHCHSPQPPEYHTPPSHHAHSHHHPHIHAPVHHQPEVVAGDPAGSLAMSSGGPREGFLDCPPLEESLELASLQHDGLAADSLHGKPSKEAFNGFPFNSASGGQNMLNSYGVPGELSGTQGDIADSIAGKLRSDVLVGEQGSSEETGLMAPSVELDELQTPWESSDHAADAHMFNEADPILGAPALESEFLDSADTPGDGQVDTALNDCLSMPSSDSQSNPVDPLPSSFMLFKELSEAEPSVEQTDLSASPPPEYAPTPLSLDMSLSHPGPTEEQEEKLSDSDVTRSAPSPVDVAGSVTFEFDKEELSQDSHSLAGTTQGPDETSVGPSEDPPEEALVETSTASEASAPQHAEENFSESCEEPVVESMLEKLTDVPPEEPCESQPQGEQPAEEPLQVPSEETTEEEPYETPSKSPNEVHLEEAPSEEPSEPVVESSLSDPTLSSVGPPSSPQPCTSPVLPVPLSVPPASPEPSTAVHIKQELLLEPTTTEIKPDPEALEPDSTTLTPGLEQTEMLEVKEEIKQEREKTPGKDFFCSSPLISLFLLSSKVY